jgi:hypothetical protein
MIAMHDAALEAHEHAEHAQHAAHESDPFVSRVSITIAILAVLAAAAGSLETFESASAIIEANKAVLVQDKATDQWNYFQAKSLKKNMFSIAADAGGRKADAYRAKAKEEGVGQDEAQAEAKKLETEREHALAVSDTHERRHHRLGIAATLLEIGIAISTIAIITKQRWPWYGAAVLGAIGTAVTGLAYLG